MNDASFEDGGESHCTRSADLAGQLLANSNHSGGGHGTAIGTSCRVNPTFPAGSKPLGFSCSIEDGTHEHMAALVELGPYWRHFDGTNLIRSDGGYCQWHVLQYDPSRQYHVGLTCLAPDPPSSCFHTEITHTIKQLRIPAQTNGELEVQCERGLLIGGACTTDGVDNGNPFLAFSRAGFRDPDAWPSGSSWQCSWKNHRTVTTDVKAVAYCLSGEAIQPVDEPEEPGCCPTFESMLSIEQESMVLGPGANRLEVTCGEGRKLMLGNCMLDGELDDDIASMMLFRMGFPPDDPNFERWGCSWNNTTTSTPRAVATAVCVDATY